MPPVEADAPKVVWALDCQFDSTTDGRAVKIASMIDEHTRESLLHVVERSITAERLVAELEKVFAATDGPPRVLRMDNGPEMIFHALQRFCADRVGISYIPPGTPGNNGFVESFNRRLRTECLNRNHWTSLFEARVVIGDFKADHYRRHRHSALGYLTSTEYAAACTHTHHPGLRDQLNTVRNHPGSIPELPRHRGPLISADGWAARASGCSAELACALGAAAGLVRGRRATVAS
ncbi:integrase core domain-containing protein [Nocardia abscessus]|uniref:integrase core domain-containing protein n=1 Tax=Nocardia abscessus TaxID=120957 RepID=UPI0024568200|nr:integrase core domain-containing protein [Nocardia abscessus]